jgi:hypothetical protein
MKMTPIPFGPWKEAYRLEAGGTELIAVTEIGPRIVSLRLPGQPNILLEASKDNFVRGDWRIWGGHRFWVSPETESTYEPDNQAGTVKVEAGKLVLTGAVEKSGLQKTLEIGVTAGGDGFVVRHRLRNTGSLLVSGGIWALTCVTPPGPVVIPWGEGSPTWTTQMVRYWRCWGGHESSVESRQWQPRNGCFVVKPSGELGKVGMYSDRGIMCQMRQDCTFIKTYPLPTPGQNYPDGGCNLEVFTCPAFIELETLGPIHTLLPGIDYEHTEVWRLIPQTFKPEQWAGLANFAG